jgi:DNA-directed RNA polymerase subunit RPC12/RpoP
MVSEFDLPCTDCEQDLVQAAVEGPSGDRLTVAECPDCGGRYYPESALERL